MAGFEAFVGETQGTEPITAQPRQGVEKDVAFGAVGVVGAEVAHPLQDQGIHFGSNGSLPHVAQGFSKQFFVSSSNRGIWLLGRDPDLEGQYLCQGQFLKTAWQLTAIGIYYLALQCGVIGRMIVSEIYPFFSQFQSAMCFRAYLSRSGVISFRSRQDAGNDVVFLPAPHGNHRLGDE